VTVALVVRILLMAYFGKYTPSGFGPGSDAWDSASAEHLYALIQTTTPKDAIIIARAPRALALYTERLTTQFPEHPDIENLTTYIAKVRATHLLVARGAASDFASLCGCTGQHRRCQKVRSA
jgi:hypothetical protein